MKTTAINVAAVAATLVLIVWANNKYVVRPAVAKNEAAWQKKWSDRDAKDAEDRLLFDSEQRSIEQSWQNHVNDIQKKADNETRKANINAAASRASAERMQLGIKEAITRLQQPGSSVAGVTASSKAADATGVLLTELYRSIDERSGELAEEADRRRLAGLACERIYDSIKKAR